MSNLVPPTLVYTNGIFTFSTNAVALASGAPGAFFQVLLLPQGGWQGWRCAARAAVLLWQSVKNLQITLKRL